MRLFIAIQFTKDIVDMLYHLEGCLKEQTISGNFSRRENLHLTLAFLGEVPENQIKKIGKIMEHAAGKSFLLELEKLGKFQGRGEALYWVGAARSRELLSLQGRLIRNLKAEGFSPDEKPFKPHITLARRCRMKDTFSEAKVTEELPETSLYVQRISLMKSERVNGKLVYTELLLVPLRGSIPREEKKEQFEILTREGKPTGRVQERSLVHKTGAPHATAHIWVIRKNQQGTYDFLLQKRSAFKDSSPGKYDISSAGHVAAGQTYQEAALRELEEELGIHAAPDDLEFVGIHRGEMKKIFYGEWFHDYEIANVYLYRRPVDEKALRLQAEEVESVLWMECQKLYQGLRSQAYPNCLYPDEIELLFTYLKIPLPK